MRVLLTIVGLVAMSFVIPPLQDARSVFLPPSPDAELWLKHVHKMDSSELLSKGVPDRYHYLYMFHADLKDADIRKALPFTKIKLSRSRCLGLCPAYEAEFSSTGEASYNGVAHTRNLGKHGAVISLKEFGRICWAVERLKLTEPQPKPQGAISDTSVTKLIITLESGQIVEVTDHGFPSSIELLLVSTLIDSIAETKDWK